MKDKDWQILLFLAALRSNLLRFSLLSLHIAPAPAPAGAELRAVLRCEKHSFSFCHPRAFRDEELFRKLKGRQKGGPGDCQKKNSVISHFEDGCFSHFLFEKAYLVWYKKFLREQEAGIRKSLERLYGSQTARKFMMSGAVNYTREPNIALISLSIFKISEFTATR